MFEVQGASWNATKALEGFEAVQGFLEASCV
jgi:hypothetical protein